MRVLDGCVIVLDGCAAWKPRPKPSGVSALVFSCRPCFRQQAGPAGADFGRALATVQGALGREAVAVTVPLPDYDGTVVHLIDCTRLRLAASVASRVETPCDRRLGRGRNLGGKACCWRRRRWTKRWPSRY